MRGFGNSHDISKENLFSFNENNLINESPGWNGFDWVIGVRNVGGDGHPGFKEIGQVLV